MNSIKTYVNSLGRGVRATVIALAVVFVSAGIAQAATTISTNILTNGTLGVTGVSTFGGTASTTISVAGVLTTPSSAVALFLGGASTTQFTLLSGDTIKNASASSTVISGALQTTGGFTGTSGTFSTTLGITGLATFLGGASTTQFTLLNGETISNASDGVIQLLGIASTTSLTLLNGETITNATDGVITLTAATTSLSGALRLTGTTAGYNALATIGTVVTDTGADISANTGRVAGLQINLASSGSTVTGFRGIDSRVTDTGTAANVVGLQALAKKTAGVSAMELWGTNSIAQLTGGSVLNAYGVVGDLTIGTGATIADVQLNSFATAGFFQSFIHTDAILAKAIDSAVTAVISSDTGRGKSAKGTFGVTSVLNGALSQSTEGASAAYKVMDFNTGANFDYGLDLYYSDSPYSNVFGTADIRLQNGDTIKNASASSTALSGSLTVGGGTGSATLTVTNTASATSTVTAGCVVTTATSSATSIRLLFNTQATTTSINGNTVQGVVLWGYGSSCAN